MLCIVILILTLALFLYIGLLLYIVRRSDL